MESQEQKGCVFNIQRYSIHDGPGIRTTVFLQGCPLRCFWCQNPESQYFQPVLLFKSQQCVRCGRCVSMCLNGASTLTEQGVVIDRAKCLGCGQCVKVCLHEARKIIGQTMTVTEVMREILRDVNFYRNSGGGITLSGGEPSAQADFCYEILRRSKEAGLHTVLDTSGYVSWKTLKNLLEYTDLVLYDIKHMDPRKHARATGKSNRLILENAKRAARFKAIQMRVPLIPGFNDSPREIQAIARFVKRELGVAEMELLSYNKMSEVKYECLGRACVPLTTQDKEQIEALRELVREELGQRVIY